MRFSNFSTLASSLPLASAIAGCAAHAESDSDDRPLGRGGSSNVVAGGGLTSTGGARNTGGWSSSSGGLWGFGGAAGSTSTSGGAAGVVPFGAGGSPGGAKSSGGSKSSGGTAGAGSMAGADGTSGNRGAVGGRSGAGACCADGDCLCHGPSPTDLTSENGPYKSATLALSTGELHYPTDAEPPLAGIAICPGFLNTGPEMRPWGAFYASWGIAVVVTSTGGADLPNVRGDKLVAAIEELKQQNVGSGPLAGKLSDRFGTSGYSMGGGGTTLASAKAPTFKTSVGLAAWGPDGTGVKVPTLFLCSDTDTVAGCTGSERAYEAMGSTAKMLVMIANADHFAWFDPNDAGQGISGAYALAFQKVYLEGDERWRPLLLAKPSQGSATTNIQ
jgi:hypothetical protein